METGTPESRSRPIKEEKDICLLYEPPSPYLDLMTKALVGSPRAGRCSVGRKSKACLPPHDPYNSFLRRFGDDWPPYGYTMIGIERLQSFMSAINEVNRNHVLGAIMEFGVWRGGAMIMAAAMQKERGTNRDLYLFDAFGPVGGNSYDTLHGLGRRNTYVWR
ncbi:unnamed protein product [Cylindrotheca closterium]|uniref:Macrocin O-methyltransferase n=1 Tax=Cylindrotheca closterium TaxID=2856 RepID=A0AAD2CU47_9STRA|nr:unnamed protein product [Cylindrotheca closterium]